MATRTIYPVEAIKTKKTKSVLQGYLNDMILINFGRGHLEIKINIK